MRTVFLDIDGVLNHPGTKAKCGRYMGVDPVLAKLYCDWVASHQDLQVVLSSTWRNHPDMHPHLHQNGIAWVDVTPRLNGIRGLDIQAWLAKHPEVTNYVILDDLSDFLPDQKPRLVQTNDLTGLTAHDLLKADELLGYMQPVDLKA